MTTDDVVRDQLVKSFGAETYLEDGSLNRRHLSQVAFADEQALARLNSIVHPATAHDLMHWAQEQEAHGALVAFCETALLRTARLDHVVDDVWHVTASDDVRIARVMARSGLTADEVRERMAAQRQEEAIAPGEKIIVNDNDTAVLPQVVRLLQDIQTQ